MKVDVNLDEIRLRTRLLVDDDDLERFDKFFDKQYEDVIINTEDYIAEGIKNQFNTHKEEGLI